MLVRFLAESMDASFSPPLHLAPLQLAMLETSGHGHHIEQIEMVFSPGVEPAKVMKAWSLTVAHTEALRLRFQQVEGRWRGVPVEKINPCLKIENRAPESWTSWLSADRLHPLLTGGAVPWRAAYWPADRRFIWTLHHALLDGRSITRILKGFSERIDGKNPAELKLARWQPAAVRATLTHVPEMTSCLPCEVSSDQESQDPACCHLGKPFLDRLRLLADLVAVTVPTLVTWSWGQALARENQSPRVIVEQLRAGAPQPCSAGFTMNLLPILIERACREDAIANLRAFRQQLLELREFENVCLEDFRNGGSPDHGVVMVEHGTLAHELCGEIIESVELHEANGQTLTATAHILPDLQLKVEGPDRQRYLMAWIRVMEDQMRQAGLLA